MGKILKKERNMIIILVFAVLFIILIRIFQEPLNSLINEQNHISVHMIVELISIFISFSIFLFGWKAYPFLKTTPFLYLPLVFLVVGLLDLFHVLTYNDMPLFITENTTGVKSKWFWLFARLTEASVVFWLLFLKQQVKSLAIRWLLLVFAFFSVLTIVLTITFFENQLPALLIDEVGSTPLINKFELFLSVLHLAAATTAFSQYLKEKEEALLDLVLAFSILFIGEFLFLFYNGMKDLDSVVAPLYKVLGYSIIFRSFYFYTIQVTFYKKNKVEKELKDTQELLGSFIKHTPDSFLIIDKNGIVVYANEGVEYTYGWKSHEIIGKSIAVFSPYDQTDDYYYEPLQRVLAGESIYGYETTHIRKDKKIIYISLTLSPIRDENGEINNVAAITRDISDRKLAEEALRKTKEDLKQTIRRQQGIIFKFRKIEGRFIHTLCDGDILYKQFNLTPQLVEGKQLSDFFSKEKANELEAYYEEAWNGNEMTYESDWPYSIIAFTLQPILQDGQVIEVIGSGVDIAKLKKTEELLRKSEKLAVVGELAAGVAHEIRNPLTTLKGFIQYLKPQLDEHNMQFIELMLSEVDRIEMITNEFMVVAKPQAVTFKKNAIQELIEHVVTFLQPQALLNNIEIHASFKTNDSTVLCDGNQLKQVFINIIKNAFEAMPNGGKLFIELSEVNNSHLLLRIKDTGCGIPKELLPKLGEPFYTLKEKGTGLGLMVSYRIIEAHKGNISFQSEVGQGTTVEIELPLYSASCF